MMSSGGVWGLKVNFSVAHPPNKMVLAVSWCSAKSLESSPHGCLDFVTRQWLGSKREEAETAGLLKDLAEKSPDALAQMFPKSTSCTFY